jgi:hypothetical protein
MSEVIDSFIPWREISKAYFHARESAPALVAPVPAPKPSLQFAEENNVHEFETDDEETEDEEEEAPPKITLGEDVKLDLDDDKASVNTEDELEAKLKESETVSLNL